MSTGKRQVWIRMKNSDDWVIAETEERTKTMTVYKLMGGAVLTDSDIDKVGPELTPPTELTGDSK